MIAVAIMLMFEILVVAKLLLFRDIPFINIRHIFVKNETKALAFQKIFVFLPSKSLVEGYLFHLSIHNSRVLISFIHLL